MTHITTTKSYIPILVLIFLILVPEIGFAAVDTGIMDSVMDKYQKSASAWGAKMVSYASWLFWGLALISMVWTYGMMLLRKADIGEFFAETIRFLGALGFFYWILLNGPAISSSIIKSMWQIGTEAVGGAASFTPSGITDIGFDIFFKVLDDSSSFYPVDSAAAILIAGCILIVLALVAVNMLLLFVSAWVLMYGGVFLLGFGGSRWTSDIAVTYYKTVIGIGAQLMAMVLLVGIGKTFIDQAYAGMSQGINLKELAVLGITSVVLLYLTNKIPPMLSGIIGGASTGNVGSFGAGAAMGAAMAAAGVAAGVASAGASMALGGAANLAGVGSALKAAFQSAEANMGGGGGTGSGGSSAGTDTSSESGYADTGNVQGSESHDSSKGSSFGKAMGTAGRFAADMTSNLVAGAKDGITAKASNMADAARDQVSKTLGGKLASEINGSAGAEREAQKTLREAAAINQNNTLQEARDLVSEYSDQSSGTTPQFDGDSVSSGKSKNDEVNDFVNGKKKEG
ncbi:P-type conjugative transfer protein TrbL [Pseudomonas helleri]|uniref:P-type conjugative transfer protein TrbL n=1 Tax=Pseudomonas helleri TaxID=1608996 RepID=UPI003FD34714